MLSYDEIINISKQYRYNYNKEAKSHYLIDKDTKTELTNMDNYEIMRIKAAIGLNTYMKHIQSSLPLDAKRDGEFWHSFIFYYILFLFFLYLF